MTPKEIKAIRAGITDIYDKHFNALRDEVTLKYPPEEGLETISVVFDTLTRLVQDEMVALGSIADKADAIRVLNKLFPPTEEVAPAASVN